MFYFRMHIHVYMIRFLSMLCCLHYQGYMSYIKSLPINDTPEIFALHENANITFAQNETNTMLTALLLLQPKTSSGGGKSREEVGKSFVKYWKKCSVLCCGLQCACISSMFLVKHLNCSYVSYVAISQADEKFTVYMHSVYTSKVTHVISYCHYTETR